MNSTRDQHGSPVFATTRWSVATSSGEFCTLKESRKTPLYIMAGRGHLAPAFMDKFWSIFAMPIGLFICFTPALLVWFRMEIKAKRDGKD